MAGQEGIEPPTCGFGDRLLCQLSYWPLEALLCLAEQITKSANHIYMDTKSNPGDFTKVLDQPRYDPVKTTRSVTAPVAFP